MLTSTGPLILRPLYPLLQSFRICLIATHTIFVKPIAKAQVKATMASTWNCSVLSLPSAANTAKPAPVAAHINTARIIASALPSLPLHMGFTSFTPLATRFPHFLLDIREGINYLKYIRGNQPQRSFKMRYTYTTQAQPKAVSGPLHNNLIASGLRLHERISGLPGEADIYNYVGALDAVSIQGNQVNVWCRGILVKQLNRLFDDLSQPIDIQALGVAFATEKTYMYAKSRRRLASLLSL
jgi:hypothetical protein